MWIPCFRLGKSDCLRLRQFSEGVQIRKFERLLSALERLMWSICNPSGMGPLNASHRTRCRRKDLRPTVICLYPYHVVVPNAHRFRIYTAPSSRHRMFRVGWVAVFICPSSVKGTLTARTYRSAKQDIPPHPQRT